MKKIVINADDYGFCPKVNEGIITAYISGAITDFSFMINSSTFTDSVSLLNRNNIHRCGIHLNLTSGYSLNSNKKFLNLKQLMINLIFKRISIIDLIKEIDFQIDNLMNSNFEITHIDSHQNIHLLPFFFEHIRNYIDSNNLKTPIRVPYETIVHPFSTSLSNLFRLSSLNLLSSFTQKYYNSAIQVVGQGFFNNKDKITVLEQVYEVIQSSEREIFEFPVHPGLCICQSNPICQDSYTSMREEELSFLLLNKDFFKGKGIEQISFADLN